MIALALTALTIYTLLADEICVDFELGVDDDDPSDDEVYEETNDKVCAWQEGKNVKYCVNGFKRGAHMGWDTDEEGCIQFPDETFSKDGTYYIEIDGSDAVWADRFIVKRWENHHTVQPTFRETWGVSNDDGYCLSRDRNDHLDWNHDTKPQKVGAKDCYYKIKLLPNGQVWGWHTSEDKMCRTTKKMDCKQGCKSGWTHISTSDDGCCASVFSCFGNRKTCALDEPCRRRSEDEEPGVTVEVLDDEENGHWVLLSSPPVHASKTADRLAQAEGVLPDGDFNPTSSPAVSQAVDDNYETDSVLTPLAGSEMSVFQAVEDLDETADIGELNSVLLPPAGSDTMGSQAVDDFEETDIVLMPPAGTETIGSEKVNVDETADNYETDSVLMPPAGAEIDIGETADIDEMASVLVPRPASEPTEESQDDNQPDELIPAVSEATVAPQVVAQPDGVFPAEESQGQ